jgi:hypothetical protein
MTDGGFVRHVFMYNVNRLDLSRLANLAGGIGAHLPLAVLAAVGAACSWQRVRSAAGGTVSLQSVRALKGDRVGFASLVLLVFLAIKTLMLPAILKSGSNHNYLIEWLSALAIFAGIAMHQLVAVALGKESSLPDRAPLLLALVVSFAVMPLLQNRLVSSQQMEARAAKLAPLVARIAAAPKPVISDDMTLLIRAGRRVAWEPAIAAELAHTGVYDEAAFVRLIRAGAFAFFATEERMGTKAFNERYNPAVTAAIRDVYPLQEDVGRNILHLPRQ